MREGGLALNRGVMAPKFNIQTAEKPELKERVAQLTTALIKQKEVRDFSPIGFRVIGCEFREDQPILQLVSALKPPPTGDCQAPRDRVELGRGQ